MENKNLKWCFNLKDGLIIAGANETLVRVYKRKSRSALNMLDSAKEKQEYDWVLDTSY